MRKNLVDTEVREGRKGRCTPGSGADVLQPVERSTVEQPMEKTTLGQISTLQPMGSPMPEQVDMPPRKQPLESNHIGVGS